MLLSVTSYFRISHNSPPFSFVMSIFLCDATEFFNFCFGFSQVIPAMMNLLVKGGSLTLCISLLNFFDFSKNIFQEKQLRIFLDTSVGKFCCVKKLPNDDADCCKVEMFPWNEITLTACCTISLKFLIFDVLISS